MQLGYIKFYCCKCDWDSSARSIYYTAKAVSSWARKALHDPFADPQKYIYLHLKSSLN
jgi:hypothetical protein